MAVRRLALVSDFDRSPTVGRVRDDLAVKGAITMFIVADNLRKGAALNAVQIAEELLK